MISTPTINDPIEECGNALEAYLKKAMPSLNQIIHDFPNPNEDLIYPSLSITHDAANAFTPLMPYEVLQEDPDVNNSADILWIVGQWDFKIQLDFWARNKVERDILFSKFFSAFNPQIEPMGLSLKLSQYFNLWARYDLTSYTHKDDEQASQRQEWRTMIGLNVHAKHALTQRQFIIIQPSVALGVTN